MTLIPLLGVIITQVFAVCKHMFLIKIVFFCYIYTEKSTCNGYMLVVYYSSNEVEVIRFSPCTTKVCRVSYVNRGAVRMLYRNSREGFDGPDGPGLQDGIGWTESVGMPRYKGADTFQKYLFFIFTEVTEISKETRINDEIRAEELRVIDDQGTMVGIMPLDEALQLADQKGMDLVEISPNADPPVAKILDFGKYRYEIQKREKEAKKKQKTMQVKEIRLSTFIEEHDIQVKAKTASKFLSEGDKVKVSLRFRGRERDHVDQGKEVMDAFAEACSDFGTVDKKPALEGRNLTMFLSPKKTGNEKKTKADKE